MLEEQTRYMRRVLYDLELLYSADHNHKNRRHVEGFGKKVRISSCHHAKHQGILLCVWCLSWFSVNYIHGESFIQCIWCISTNKRWSLFIRDSGDNFIFRTRNNFDIYFYESPLGNVSLPARNKSNGQIHLVRPHDYPVSNLRDSYGHRAEL